VLQVFQPAIGGVPTYVLALSLGLAERSWRVTVACPPDAIGVSELRRAGIETVPISVGRGLTPRADARAVRALASICRHEAVALIHGHSSKANLLTALLSRMTGLPSMYTPHGWSFEMQVPPLARAALATVEAALVRGERRRVLTVSHAEACSARRWRVAGVERLVAVQTGLASHAPGDDDRRVLRAKLGVSPEDFVVAWIGRVGRPKRPEDLVPLARQLADRGRIVALCADLEQRPGLAEGLRDSGVILAAPDCRSDVLLAAADVMLLTSAWEAFPLVVLEAMRAGRPVVATAVGGVGEQVADGVTGLLCPPGDIDGLAHRLAALADDPTRRATMGIEGRRRFDHLFGSEKMMATIDRLYREALVPG
jgi:glycosyltransferase involved in cell wall biosynthesis